MLFELKTPYAVDSAIMGETERLVIILFQSGQSDLEQFLESHQVLLVNMAIFFKVNIEMVPQFNNIYDITEDTVMIFYKNKHVQTEFGSKLIKVIESDKFVQIIQKAYINVKKVQKEIKARRTKQQ
ncbi:Mitosis_protein DIM1 domain-containing protein [Hexamita inflata]|uniref:Mitosis protein DIM1 domain-containing protein n=1 Tax=Hexamita inflata TaxID=28002 RepID=A0AA86QYT7_9EUKA|nr:Mitosis protein DIM1 domain-containing protein [Hexamita inflata]